MQILFAVSAALTIASSAYAAPTVGTSATHACKYQGQSVTRNSVITSVNTAEGTFTTQNTTTYNGQSQVDEATSSIEEYSKGEEFVANISLRCNDTAFPGAQLEMGTVPAGTFEACHVKTVESGMMIDAYMANVPFQTVRFSVTNQDVGCDLVSFQKN